MKNLKKKNHNVNFLLVYQNVQQIKNQMHINKEPDMLNFPKATQVMHALVLITNKRVNNC